MSLKESEKSIMEDVVIDAETVYIIARKFGMDIGEVVEIIVEHHREKNPQQSFTVEF